MTESGTYIGETLALITAVVWALAVVCFKKSGEAVHPIGLNVFKNLLAVTLLVPTAWLLGETLFRPVPASEYLLLLLSGALGIGISDTLFFKSLNILGAGLSAIVDCLYSPFVILFSILLLNETLTVWQFVGVVMILSAVLSILVERHDLVADRRKVVLGIVWGALAMVTTAFGIVIIKPLLSRSPLIWATEVRLVGGLIVLIVVLVFMPSRWAVLKTVLTRKKWQFTVAGSMLGTYISMVLWLAGMKFTQASTAAALNQTSNIFVFIFAAFLLKEKITKVRLVAIALGIMGALVVTFGGGA